ncbi:SHOCT domain-containing protein [Arthrobacter sp. I2-34]|uniref:SHOCT domain-containing protein n=1 Tax=Arthrobacter hankyongi TaxID=2904801 RepID=A0ABS9L529_9MICC|nr:SHOCT domain-containing protein [Arthrobacter hankyongi]MCG2621648.1 SHOCT domain-containing protein [Arthrobacter hankyongi]
MMYGWDGGWGVGGWIAMALMMLLFWGGVVTVAILLIRGPRHAGWGAHEQSWDDAERILNERFARGEIDEQELNARRAALRRRP